MSKTPDYAPAIFKRVIAATCGAVALLPFTQKDLFPDEYGATRQIAPLQSLDTYQLENPFHFPVEQTPQHAPLISQLKSDVAPQKPTPLDFPALNINPEDNELENQSDTQKRILHPEKLSIPADVATDLAENTVYLGNNGCSGRLIHNGNSLVGFSTAEHCSLKGISTQRYTGIDGKRYIVQINPIRPLTGDTMKNLLPAGEVSEIALPKEDDTSQDLAVAGLNGHSAQEALAAYADSAATQDQLKSLTLGDTMYLSGWPTAQFNELDAGDRMNRQSFALSYLGQGIGNVQGGESIQMVFAAMPKSKDGAICSFGNSGGVGLIHTPTGLREVGALASFSDLTGKVYGDSETASEWKSSAEAEYGVSLDGYDAICGFALKAPDLENGDEVVKVVTSPHEIPGFAEQYSQEAVAQRAFEYFSNPEETRYIIDGIVEAYSSTLKGEALIPNFYIDRPVYFLDPVSGQLALCYYDPSAPNKLNVFLPIKDSPVTVYDRDTTPGVRVIASNTEIQFGEDNFSDLLVEQYGKVLDTDQPINTTIGYWLNPILDTDSLPVAYDNTGKPKGGK